MVTGRSWFRVPAALRFTLKGVLPRWSSGKDVILSIIGQIGVSGAQYRSMEFDGDGIDELTMTDRLTMANMAIEAGAKNAVFPVDAQTTGFLRRVTQRSYTPDVYKRQGYCNGSACLASVRRRCCR